MKNEQQNSSVHNTQTVNFQHQAISCPSNQPSIHVCCNKNCLNSAFICEDKSCQCFQNHRKCPLISIESIKNNIKAKIIPLEDINQSIIQKIQKTIDELSDFRQKLSNQIKKNLQFYGLTKNEQKFLNAFNKPNGVILTGKQVSQMFTLLLNEQNKQAQSNPIQQKFASIWQTLKRQIDEKTSKIFELFNLIQDNTIKTRRQLFDNSKVIVNSEYKQNLKKMFSQKTLLQAKLLYRASQNNFSTKAFHEKCDNIPHTVTVCKTQHKKVIGGYTPVVWNQSNLLLQDLTGESFIFSLTNNHKFILDKSKIAIYQYSGSGPLFGTSHPDFHIGDSANSGNNSWTKINQSYYNQNYIRDNSVSYDKFNGNLENSYFYKAEEWEVWEIKFAQ